MCVQRFDNLLSPVVLSLMRKNEEKAARTTIYAAGSDVLLVSNFILENLYLFLSLLQADVSHGIFAIEDLGDLLEGRAFSLNEDEVHPDCFKDIPKLQTQWVLENRDHEDVERFKKGGSYGIEEPEIPAVRQVLNGDRVRLG